MVLEKDTFQIENKENECKKYQIFLNVKNLPPEKIDSSIYLEEKTLGCLKFPILEKGENIYFTLDHEKLVKMQGKSLLVKVKNTNDEFLNLHLSDDSLKYSDIFTRPQHLSENLGVLFKKEKEGTSLIFDSKQALLNTIAQETISAKITSFRRLGNSEEIEIQGEFSPNNYKFLGIHFHHFEIDEWESYFECSIKGNFFTFILNLKKVFLEPGKYIGYLRFEFEEQQFFVSLASTFQNYLKIKVRENEYKTVSFDKNHSFSIRWYFENYNLLVSNFRIESDKYIFKLAQLIEVGEIKSQIRIKRRKTNEFIHMRLFKKNDELYFFTNDLDDFKVDELFRGDLQLPIYYPSGRVDYYYLKEDTTNVGNYLHVSMCKEAPSLRQSFYIAQNGKISYVIATRQRLLNEYYSAIDPKLKKISVKKNLINIAVDTGTSMYKAIGIHIHFRKGENWEEKTVLPVSETKSKNDGIIQYFSVDVNKYNWEQFYQDIYLKYQVDANTYFFRKIKNESRFIKWKLKYSLNSNQFLFPYDSDISGNYLIYPYITRSSELSINYRVQGKFETKKYKRNEKIAVFQFLLTWWRPDLKNIWLTHEKYSETAQDNSYYFFKYMYKNHPEKKMFYVIDTQSKDYKRLNGMEDRVLPFMSRKHLYYLLFASMIVASESKGHGFSWRTSKGLVRQFLDIKPFVFLQHGVLGLKKIDDTFSASGLNKAEVFTTSSEFEKQIVIDYLGYPNDSVVVTGLPRWDNLNQDNTKKSNTILIMPTWRNWLEEVEDKVFLESDYFLTYNMLINSKELANFLEKEGMIANFYLHPKFNQYSHLFSNVNSNVRIIYFGEAPVNDLIKQASILITDYSSVAWEALYQKIPTLFYQFDQSQYIEEQGAYMDLNDDLFGPISFTEEELLQELSTALNKTTDSNTMSEIQSKYFAYVDQNNSKRVFWEINKRKNYIEKSPFMLLKSFLKKKMKRIGNKK
ncbi:CDP-glycerol glycerophosphotransferase family protein [Enterococcus casseliflavus]|uniref:CDP-glycerol glycerophosphotransferase family protein n=1 Tax=Enterococcus casseliflavus TaxID=37734 RepID=UPI002FBE27CD